MNGRFGHCSAQSWTRRVRSPDRRRTGCRRPRLPSKRFLSDGVAAAGGQAQLVGGVEGDLAEPGPRFRAGREILVRCQRVLVVARGGGDPLVEVDAADLVIDGRADVAGPARLDAGLLVLLGREGAAEHAVELISDARLAISGLDGQSAGGGVIIELPGDAPVVVIIERDAVDDLARRVRLATRSARRAAPARPGRTAPAWVRSRSA